jgi:hypothetical protein
VVLAMPNSHPKDLDLFALLSEEDLAHLGRGRQGFDFQPKEEP